MTGSVSPERAGFSSTRRAISRIHAARLMPDLCRSDSWSAWALPFGWRRVPRPHMKLSPLATSGGTLTKARREKLDSQSLLPLRW